MKQRVIAGISIACVFALQAVRADGPYATSGTTHYTSTTDDLAAFLGEIPQGPYAWTHTGNFFMYAGGLLTSLADLDTTTPAVLTLKDATVSVSGEFAVASGGTVDSEPVGGSGELTLDNTTMTVNGKCSVVNQNVLGGSKPSNPVVGRLTLKNGSTLTVGGTFSITANAASSADWNASVTNVLTISDTSTLDLGSGIERWDGPSGLVVFDGGRFVIRGTKAFFRAGGYGRSLSSLVVTNTPGNDIRLENTATNSLFDDKNMGFLLADGAIEKSGRGVLNFNGPSSDNGWVERLAFNGMRVREGVVVIYNSFTFRDPETFPQYRRGTVELLAGARLDLNNNGAFIEDLTGAGTIHASYEAGADLTLCNPSDMLSTVKLGRGLKNIVKRGDAVAQVVPFGTDAEKLWVSGGTLKFADSPLGGRGYTHYRFRVLDVNNGASTTEIMELREVKLFGGDADVTYAAGFNYDSTTAQEGGTGIFGNNELPEKAIDMNLTSKWCDLRHKSQDCWWIEFVYPTPVQVTSYNWAKTDNWQRSPCEWVLEGSDDGASWTTLSHEALDTRNLPANNWVGDTPFATSLAGTQVSRIDDIIVASGATLDLSGYSGRLLTKAISGNVTVGDNASLVIDVGSDELHLAPSVANCKFFRWTIKATRSQQAVMECAKFYLFDKDGNVQNLGLSWNQEHGTPARGLAPGSFCQAGDYKYSVWNGDYQDPTRLFRADTDYNKWCTIEHTFVENDSSTWYVINMRLADGANPIAGYNIRTVGGPGSNADANRPIAAWLLECSDDGENWMTFDEQSIGTSAPTTGATWYNAGIPYSPTGDDLVDVSSQVLPAKTIVSIAGGTLDARAVPATRIDSLEVDMSAAEGAITLFNPAANGVLRIVNAGSSPVVDVPLLAVAAMAQGANAVLKSWTVTVDGEPLATGRLHVKVGSGHLMVGTQSGLAILVR